MRNSSDPWEWSQTCLKPPTKGAIFVFPEATYKEHPFIALLRNSTVNLLSAALSLQFTPLQIYYSSTKCFQHACIFSFMWCLTQVWLTICCLAYASIRIKVMTSWITWTDLVNAIHNLISDWWLVNVYIQHSTKWLSCFNLSSFISTLQYSTKNHWQ